MKQPKPKKRKPGCCGTCGKRWIDHHGIEQTCRRLQNAREALVTIRLWASTGLAQQLNARVIEICDEALGRSK